MSNAPKQPGEVLLERHELRPGDRLFGREFHDWHAADDFPGHLVLDDKYVETAGNNSKYEIACMSGSGRWRVVRACTQQHAKPGLRHWNGKCRCGSNIYIGFLSIEHEAAECRS